MSKKARKPRWVIPKNPEPNIKALSKELKPYELLMHRVRQEINDAVKQLSNRNDWEERSLDQLIYCAKQAFSYSIGFLMGGRNFFGSPDIVENNFQIPKDESLKEYIGQTAESLWNVIEQIECLRSWVSYINLILDRAYNPHLPQNLYNLREGILAGWPITPDVKCFHVYGISALNAMLEFFAQIVEPASLIMRQMVTLQSKIAIVPPKSVYITNIKNTLKSCNRQVQQILPLSDWPDWKVKQEQQRVECLLQNEIETAKNEGIVMGCEEADEQPSAAERTAKKRISKNEANILARQILEKYPSITARDLAEKIPCSVGLVPKLTAWKAVQEQRKQGRKPKTPKAVSLTNKLLEIFGEEDIELERLTNEQKDEIKAEEAKHFIQRRKP